MQMLTHKGLSYGHTYSVGGNTATMYTAIKSSFTISTSGHHCLQEADAYQPVSTLPSQHPTQVKRGAPCQGLDHQHVEQASEEVNHLVRGNRISSHAQSFCMM